jgi:hypothetical protein
MTTTRPSGYGVDSARRALAICWLSLVLACCRCRSRPSPCRRSRRASARALPAALVAAGSLLCLRMHRAKRGAVSLRRHP